MNIQSEKVIVLNRRRYLVGMLRAAGLLDVLALFAVIAPRTWIAGSHRNLGMGEFPVEPIAGYLARSTSVWYVLYGLLLWFVSCDVEKYVVLISCLAWLMIAQGFIIFGIDVVEEMPVWWTTLEGPCSAGLGISILLLQRFSRT